ncbi:MAG: ECF-type sigma factor [Planctomycetota bacterium]
MIWLSNRRFIIDEQENGSRDSAEYLARVYAELRELARNRLAREKPGQTLTPTALVHETYLRLCKPGTDPAWDSTAHFFGAAAEAMRRILIDIARKKASIRRGVNHNRIDFAHAELSLLMDPDKARATIELSDSLDVFGKTYPQEALLVKLRFFGGLTMEEAAETIGVTRRTAQRYWKFSKAALTQIMQSGSDGSNDETQVRDS